MKHPPRKCRIHALALAIGAVGLGCVTDAAVARAALTTRQTVAMVRAGQFAALDRYYSDVQSDYDKGSISDDGLRSEFRHFYDSAPDLAARYATWVKDTPDSYVAHLARAIYYVRVGEESRGDKFIADTSEARLSGMDRAFALASTELKTSLSLEKKPLLTVFYALDIGKYEGDATRNRALFQVSLALDRRNFIVRDMYMQTLSTAWGGSTEQLRAFAAESKAAGLSAKQMKHLESLVFEDEAWVDDFHNHDYKRAAAEYLEAARVSGDDGCVLCAGKVLVKGGDFPDAARVLTQYLARHPKSMEALKSRVYVYYKLGRPADEARDYERLAELGDANSEYNLATMYLAGQNGLPRDGGAAVRWLRSAAAKGNADSEYTLGTMCLVGQNGLPKDRRAGIRWLRQAAAHGNPSATKLLPLALDKGYSFVSSPGGISAYRGPPVQYPGS